MTPAELIAEATGELLGRANEKLTLHLNPAEAFCILSQIQLAARHPSNGGRAATFAANVARVIEAWLGATPAAAELARRGWNAESDMEVKHGK